MFFSHIISPSASALLETKNIMSISYTDLTMEPSLFHKHCEAEILLPVGGQGTFLTQYHQTIFIPHHLYIVNPQTSHTEKTDQTLQYYVVKFKNIILPNNKNFIDLPLSKKEYETLQSFLSSTIQELEQKDNYANHIAYLHLSNFYFHVKRIITNANQKFASMKNKIASSEVIHEVKNYISTNYGLDLKINQIAKHFLISPNNLTLIFKKEVGCTPQQFLLQTRINAAKYLLISTDYTITQISSLCGFNSSAHFTEIFKKYTNVTPSNFKISSTNKNDIKLQQKTNFS